MPTHFSERFEFAAAPDAVFAVLVDPAFLAARAERTAALDHTESVTVRAGTTVVATSRTVRTTALPQAASRFLGSTAVVDQVEQWEPAGAGGARQAQLTLTIRSAPVELVATTKLAPAGRGSLSEISGSLTVRVPLLGASVEKAALPGLLQLVQSEVALAREWLAP